MELLIVTGMSGAGKSQTANVLEDIGFYCVDNVPPAIIPSFVKLSAQSGGKLSKLTIVTDTRGGNLFDEISSVLETLKENNLNFKILFLDASKEVLIKRYKENRRKHPLADETTSIAQAVEKEQEKLNSIRLSADYVIDTSYISIAQLKLKLSGIFYDNLSNSLKVQCKSFGFKHGVDSEADLVFDVRCLPNPFYVEDLKHKTGLDSEIKEFVMNGEDSLNFYSKLKDFIDCAIPLYVKEGKSQIVIAIGCTGGKHRSVTIAELLGNYLKEKNYDCNIIHRDINKR